MCVSVCVMGRGHVYTEVRGQPCGIDSLFPSLCDSLGWNSGHQALMLSAFTRRAVSSAQTLPFNESLMVKFIGRFC